MSDFSLTRSLRIAASPEQIRPWIDDFHRWSDWSPWHGLDPNMTVTYNGPQSGEGAQQSWCGNKEAGEGSMRVLHSSEHRVDVELTFIKPFAATNHVRFDLVPIGADATEVRWTMTGQHTVLMRVFYTVFRMEKKLAADFDRGLAALKRSVETAAA
ncbi:MAG: SRPBCC family protein [Micrococcus sp.]|nr:SRPBCC family protein [Micrococcus sp.]